MASGSSEVKKPSSIDSPIGQRSTRGGLGKPGRVKESERIGSEYVGDEGRKLPVSIIDLKELSKSGKGETEHLVQAARPLSSVERAIQELIRIERVSNSPGWSEKLFRDEFGLKHSRIIGAVSEQHGLIGFAIYHNLIDFGHIVNLAVLPLHRGQGIGSLLLTQLLDYFLSTSVRSIVLEVRESNLVAQALYGKFGFRAMGTRPHYYADNMEDAVVMKVELLDEALG